MTRFVVDDASWAPDAIDRSALELGLDDLVDRILVARTRGEGISMYEGLWDLSVVGDDTVAELLYGVENRRGVHRDVRVRLQRQLDQLAGTTFDEVGLRDVDVELRGERVLSPAVAYAHQHTSRHACVACLTPSCSGRSGPLAVTVAGLEAPVHFVGDERAHVEFFRDVIRVEHGDEDTFGALANSAFPDLRFVAGVWRGLRDLSRPYRDRRDDLIRCLGVLNDEGARIFDQAQHLLIERGFGAHRIDISTENSETLRDPACRRARQRQYGPDLLVFDWHLKIERHIDRIHVHPGTIASGRRVIVGIIADHLPLPGDV